MKWNKLLTTKRFGMENYYQGNHDGRTEYQRDYDRLIFSPAELSVPEQLSVPEWNYLYG